MTTMTTLASFDDEGVGLDELGLRPEAPPPPIDANWYCHDEDWYCRARKKPLWRGVAHQVSAWASPVWATPMLSRCWDVASSCSVSLFVASAAGLFFASSSYHRKRWTLAQERLWSRLDYSCIFCLVGFSYAPTYVMLLPPARGWAVIAVLAMTVALGISLTFSGTQVGRKTMVWLFVSQGAVQVVAWMAPWSGVDDRPTLYALLTPTERVLFWSMAFIYLAGSQIYAHRWPNPWPDQFGYHEIWHLLIVVACGCSYVGNWSVLERTRAAGIA